MGTAKVLVVDDERLIRWSLRQSLEDRGYGVMEASCGGEALTCIPQGVDLAILDSKLPDFQGVELLKRFRAAAPDTPVVMITSQSSVEGAVEAMRSGACYYASKPFEADEMMAVLAKMLQSNAPRQVMPSILGGQEVIDLDRIVGQSPVMREFKTLLRKISMLPGGTVMITGETGVGKDLAARALHASGSRKHGPFMHITCSALPEALLESELFGHERGAFTDAKTQKKGLFELASEGTVFLDEIGEMSLILQAKLLRFLEEKTFKRVGGSVDIRVDAAVVAATNRDLRADVVAGRFREDLYYRLNVMPLEVPPLRERSGDVPLLVKFYVDRFNAEFSKAVTGVSPDAMELLQSNPWAGNVRELRNVVQRAMLLTEKTALQASDFPKAYSRPTAASATSSSISSSSNGCLMTLPPRGLDFERLERDLVVQALTQAGGNQTRAGALLGMNRDQIRYRIDKFGLRRGSEAPSGSNPVLMDMRQSDEDRRHVSIGDRRFADDG